MAIESKIDMKLGAKLQIYNARDMSDFRRHEIAKWLKRHARMIEKDGWNYAKTFTGKYYNPDAI